MNEILQEFKVVFGLDNSQLENGIKKSETSLKNFGKFFGGLVATFASYNLFKGIVSDYVDFNTKLKDNIDYLGLSVEKVTSLGGALKRFGGSTDSVINAVSSLNNHLESAKMGGGALIELSKRYGIAFNPFQSADDALLSLGKQLGKFSTKQRAVIAEQLGFDKALTNAFANGGAELEKLIKKQKEIGVITQEDLRISSEFNNAFLDLKDIFSALMRDISRAVLPAFTKLVELFTSFIEFLRKHKALVVGFFVALLVALSPILLTFIKIGIASVAAFAPIYAVIGVVSAIALVLEDLYFYFKGWDSVTGGLVEKFPLIKGVLEIIKPLVLGIFETFEAIIEFLKNPSWDKFKNIFAAVGKSIKEFIIKAFNTLISLVDKLQSKFKFLTPILLPLKILIESIRDVFIYIFDLISGFSFDGLINGFKSIKETFSSGISGFIDKFNPFSSKKEIPAMQSLPATPEIPFSSGVTNSNNSYNINNNINQNITSATPKALADSTNKILIDSVNNIRQQRGAL